MRLDLYLFDLINSLASRNELVDFLFIFFAKYLGYLLIICLFIFLATNFQRNKNIFVASLVSAFFARFALVELIRFFYQKPRPFVVQEVTQLISHEATASLPSGHTAFFFALSIILFLHNKKLGSIFLAASLLIGLSRVAAGVHWPLDIITGILIGLLSGLIIWSLYKKPCLSKVSLCRGRDLNPQARKSGRF